jgi:hypothetical protein
MICNLIVSLAWPSLFYPIHCSQKRFLSKESFLEDFHKHKDIFLESHAYQRTIKGARNRKGAFNASGFQSDQRCLEEIREIREKSHFNFIKFHVLSHYREYVGGFGSIPQYSTDINELANVCQMIEGYGASNKVNAAMQILDYGGRRLALEI